MGLIRVILTVAALGFLVQTISSYGDYGAIAIGVVAAVLLFVLWKRSGLDTTRRRVLAVILGFTALAGIGYGTIAHNSFAEARLEEKQERERAEVRALIKKEREERVAAKQASTSGNSYSDIDVTNPETLKLRRDYTACLRSAVKWVTDAYSWDRLVDSEKKRILGQFSPRIRDDRDRCLRERGWTALNSQKVRDIDDTYRDIGVVLF